MFNNKNYRKTGSLAIELSLLMPGIISVILLIIFIGFYYSDKCTIERAAYIAVLRCANDYENDSTVIPCTYGLYDMETLVKSYFYKETDGRLIGAWNLDSYVDTNDECVMLHVFGNMNWPGGFFSDFIADNILTVNIEESAYILDIEEYLRR